MQKSYIKSAHLKNDQYSIAIYFNLKFQGNFLSAQKGETLISEGYVQSVLEITFPSTDMEEFLTTIENINRVIHKNYCHHHFYGCKLVKFVEMCAGFY